MSHFDNRSITISCIVIILSILIWVRRQQVKRERQNNVARSGELIMDMFAEDEECKEWVDNKIQQIYAHVSDEEIITGNTFLEHSKLFNIKFESSAELREEIN